MKPNIGLIIRYQNDTWKLLGEGTLKDGKVYCHLASTTRGQQQKNGFRPIQMADWIPQELILLAAIEKEEIQRKEFNKCSIHMCVPWRGADGDLGKCIYCGSEK